MINWFWVLTIVAVVVPAVVTMVSLVTTNDVLDALQIGVLQAILWLVIVLTAMIICDMFLSCYVRGEIIETIYLDGCHVEEGGALVYRDRDTGKRMRITSDNITYENEVPVLLERYQIYKYHGTEQFYYSYNSAGTEWVLR